MMSPAFSAPASPAAQASKANAAGLRYRVLKKATLKAGAALVPTFGFGHTEHWSIHVDPFGVLRFLSEKLEASVVPFTGRWLSLIHI